MPDSNVIYLGTVLFLSSVTVLQNIYFTFEAIRSSNGGLSKYLEAYSRPVPYYLVADRTSAHARPPRA